MRVRAAVPGWMLGDGEYLDLRRGDVAEFGFALVPASIVAADGMAGVVQDGVPIPVTTIVGSLVRPSEKTPVIVDGGSLRPILMQPGPPGESGTSVSVTGRLLVEPYLWVQDGVLWPLVPDGVRLWTVHGVEYVRPDGPVELAGLPSVADVDHDADYVLDLGRD